MLVSKHFSDLYCCDALVDGFTVGVLSHHHILLKGPYKVLSIFSELYS